jgi:L-asparaginase type II
MTRWFVLALLLVAVPAAAQPQPVSAPDLPRVRVIATGGTIAGVQDAPGTLGGYRAGTRSVSEIVQSVPELTRFAQIETEQFSNVASPEIMPSHWIALSKRINELLQHADLAGVVVTHGTDRLEETAFFLYLTVKSDKPVVVVGSQRPATGISPDGPINLLSAVRTAAAPGARGMGVIVVMDDRIISARENRKLYPRTGGFSGGEMGMLGVVASRGPEFFFRPARRHGVDTEFDIAAIDALPTVELVFSYPGGEGPRLGPNTEGVVAVTTSGFSPSERDAFSRSGGAASCWSRRSRAASTSPAALARARTRSPGPAGRAAGRRPTRRPGAADRQPEPAAHRVGATPAAAEGAHPVDAGADEDQGSARDPAHLQRILTPSGGGSRKSSAGTGEGTRRNEESSASGDGASGLAPGLRETRLEPAPEAARIAY